MLERLAIIVTADGGQAVKELGKVGVAADKSLGKAEQGSARMSAAFVSGGTKMAVGAAIVGAGLWKAGQAASALNEQVSQSGAVFGESAEKIEDFAKSASAIGFSEAAARRALNTFGLLFTNMGKSREEAAGMSIRMTQLASDIASFKDISIGDAMEKLASGLAGEIRPLRDIGIDISDLTLKQKALDMGLVETTTGTLPMSIKMQAAYAAILDQSKVITGDFARTADEYANSQRRVNAETENAAASLGESFLPAMKATQAGLSGLATGFAGANEASHGLVGNVTSFATLGIGAAGAFSVLAGATMKASRNLSDFRDNASGVQKGLVGVTGAITGVATAYGIWTARLKESEQAAASLGEKATAGLRRMTGEQGYEGLLRQQQRVKEQTDSLIADAEAWNPLQVWDADAHIDTVNAIEELKKSQAAMDDLKRKAEELAHTEGIDLDQALKRVMATQRDAEDATKDATKATDDNISTVLESVGANKDQARSFDDVSSKMSDYYDRVNGSTNAQVESRKAFEELHRQARETGTGFNWITGQVNLNTEAGRDFRQATLDTIEALTQEDLQIARNTGSIEQGRLALERHRKELVDHLVQLGLSRQGAEAFVTSLGFVPSEVVTYWKQEGLGEALQDITTLSGVIASLQGWNGSVNWDSFNSGISGGISGGAGAASRSATGLPPVPHLTGGATRETVVNVGDRTLVRMMVDAEGRLVGAR